MSGGGSPGRLRIEQQAGSEAEATLHVIGELDLVTAPLLAEAIGRHREEGSRIVLDLSRIEFLDSTGLVLLMQSARDVDRLSLRREVSPAVARLLEVTKTEQLFAWVDD